MSEEEILEKILKRIKDPSVKNRKDLETIKREMAKKYDGFYPKNTRLLKAYHRLREEENIEKSKKTKRILRKRPVRSLSGIVNVSVLTKPYKCPGNCIFCPSGKNAPQSYLKGEPAVDRAIGLKYNPYRQVFKRLKSLKDIGHPIDKVELRIIGGTWSFYPKEYRKEFIKQCFKAANDFPNRQEEKKDESFKKLQDKNEKAKARLIGITIETRPDFVNKEEIKSLRKLGITRVEIGAQTIYNKILKANRREHTKEDTIKATRLLKDAGFKVSYQMMPNLFKSNIKKDKEMFKKIFNSPGFQPDLLKIYPTALLEDTPLYEKYQKGEFKPYTKKQLIDLLIEIKKDIPPYCRIQRVIRDIPAQYIKEGGVQKSNMREIVQNKMKEKGLKCNCIRCREIKSKTKTNPSLKRREYKASKGKEIFLTFEDKQKNKLIALLRLRIPNKNSLSSQFPCLKNAGIIREVHTYGQLAQIGEEGKSQHKGLGKKLIKKAEKIVKEETNKNKMVIISGVGVRGYYREKLDYKLKETYMIKDLDHSN